MTTEPDSPDGQNQLELITREEASGAEPVTIEASDLAREDNEDDPEAGHSRKCAFCGKRVSLDDESTHREVRSWVSGTKKDSAVLRSYTGRSACGECITLLRAGIAPGQQDLYELLDGPAVVAIPDHVFTDRSAEYELGFRLGFSGAPEPRKLTNKQKQADLHEGYESGRAALDSQRWTPDAESGTGAEG